MLDRRECNGRYRRGENVGWLIRMGLGALGVFAMGLVRSPNLNRTFRRFYNG
jgi:hypothetical protein